jgi:glycerol-3-phosphate cytidylyltransferase
MSSEPNANGTVLVVGVFDLFHVGHVKLLRSARSLGNQLIVLVNGDELTASYKRAPIMSEDHRLEILQACRYVDHAEISKIYDIRPVVKRERISKIVHGDEWEVESYKQQISCDDEFLRLNGAELVLIPYTAGVSTSNIIRTCAARLNSHDTSPAQ